MIAKRPLITLHIWPVSVVEVKQIKRHNLHLECDEHPGPKSLFVVKQKPDVKCFSAVAVPDRKR